MTATGSQRRAKAEAIEGLSAEACPVCRGSGVLVNNGEGLHPCHEPYGDVLPNLVGGTIVKLGEMAECPKCNVAVDDPEHPAGAMRGLADIERLEERGATP